MGRLVAEGLDHLLGLVLERAHLEALAHKLDLLRAALGVHLGGKDHERLVMRLRGGLRLVEPRLRILPQLVELLVRVRVRVRVRVMVMVRVRVKVKVRVRARRLRGLGLGLGGRLS